VQRGLDADFGPFAELKSALKACEESPGETEAAEVARTLALTKAMIIEALL